MPAQWSPFIDEVSDILENRGSSDAKDFGNKLANAYLTAIKGNAECIPAVAPHQSSAGESAFIASYEQWFHDLWEKGEPVMLTPDNEDPLVNQKDNLIAFLATTAGAATRLTIEGKDNDPEYNKLEDEIGEGIKYEPTEELDKYLEEYKDDNNEDLYRFRFYEFHRLDGKETADELARIFATRLLMRFEDIANGDQRWDFRNWTDRLAKNEHPMTNSNTTAQRKQNRTSAINTLKGLDWNWRSFTDSMSFNTGSENTNGEFHLLVSDYVLKGINNAHPIVEDENGNMETEEKAIKKVAVYSIKYPWPFDEVLPPNYEEMEPSEKLKVRYPFKLNYLKIQEPREENNKMPPVLRQNLIAEFSWNGSQYYGQRKHKVKPDFIETELRKKWQGCPLGIGHDTQDAIVNMPMSNTGTLAKQIRNVLIIEQGIEAAMLAEGGSKDDPYKELAKATLKYWKDTMIQPFAPSPPTPPCTSVPVLQGKYIGVSYGNQKKLADNIRRALNSGKDEEDGHNAAEDVASALAYSYSTHLSQMKFIYLGGIQVPLVPYIPMIGYDATVI